MKKEICKLLSLTVPLTQSSLSFALFPNNQYAPYYWEAFIQQAKNNTQKAHDIIEAIQSQQKLTPPAWYTEEHSNFDDYLDALFISTISEQPFLISQLGIFDKLGIYSPNEYLNNLCPTGIKQHAEKEKDLLKKLDLFSESDLTDKQKISFKICSWVRQDTVRAEPFLFHKYYVNQMYGVLQKLVILFTDLHSLKNLHDCKTYINRLNNVPAHLKQIKELMEYQKENGIVPPHFALEKTITMIDTITPPIASDSIFYSHLITKAESLSLPTDEIALQATTILNGKVYPAFKELKEYCSQLLDSSHLNGVWSLPKGNEYYQYTLQEHTSTYLTAEEIHEIGIKEVKIIHQKIVALLTSLGIQTDDPIKALQNIMDNQGCSVYKNTEDDKKKCLNDYQAILERCRDKLQPLFNIKPDIPVAIQAVPPHLEKNLPIAFYRSPDFCGTRPGIFFVNLRDMTTLNKFLMETLAVHEAEPGHHFQLSLEIEINIPLIQKIQQFNAFVEGWALYCERLAFEEGFFSSAYTELGYLQMELFRSARLVVDTGIHYKKWSYETAIDYLQKTIGDSLSTIIPEIERYFVFPGQACSYKIGQLKILELRDTMKKALGNQFDIRTFHDLLLQNGEMPLTTLEEVITDYIKNHKESIN